MSDIDLRSQLEQPLTLAYLSCVTMAMLDKNTRQSEDPEAYVSGVLDTAKVMVELVIKEQLEGFSAQLESIKTEQDIDGPELEKTLMEIGIPSLEGFTEMVEGIVGSHADKFDQYKVAILAEIDSQK